MACGVRVEDIEEPVMWEIMTARTPVPGQASRVILDKLIDELAKGKAMEKILRGA